ncbi:MAG: LytR C-terminal domain-containing protein [Gemmatimonadetes bacterium]|nr:LytR C-terminal domain-containing protein [Gemmatimonadota bacterium]NNM07105.1 LytR C-terminal domain-containing protein [Gemmatimonadota bacterium]
MGKRFRVLVFLLVLSGVGTLLGSALSRSGLEDTNPLPPSVLPGTPERVKVEVLNGAGVPGMALEATRVLRDLGFDVVYFGNAGTYSDEPSVVLDRVGDSAKAAAVGEVLGIPLVRTVPDSTLLLDLTVRLGPDWEHPGTVAETTNSDDPWWDIRRFFRKGTSPARKNP